MSNPIIYIPTMTSILRNHGVKNIPENILYSPNSKIENVYKASNITIWDNHTFYYKCRYIKPDRHKVAKNHYLWLIDFIRKNYIEGVTLITPDVEWLEEKEEIYTKWYKYCRDYPQLYVPQTWETSNGLNIVGYALRTNTPSHIIHKEWNHCLRHKRDINCDLLTYDSTCPL